MSAHLSLVWSDSLETLAERLRENRRAASSADPFTPTCIVTGNALRKDWLHRQLVQRAPAPERLVANLDFQLLYPFVNDWLFAAFEARPITERKPAEHPYSQQMLRWRIRNILSRDLPRYPALYRYVGDSPQNADTRIFSLAGVLARVFDTYQVRRPEMLHRWETEELPPGAPAAEKWQCQLWRALVQQLPNSYLTQFLALKQREIRLETAFSCGMPRYDSVHVFGVNDLPRPFLLFFKRLAEILPVTLYAFNPSEEMWFDDAPFRAARQEVFRELLDGTLDLEPGEERISREIAERSHPLLGRFALAIQGFLAHLLDELDANQEPLFDTIQPGADTLLGRVRRHIRERRTDDERANPVAAVDRSLRLLLAHSPRRELEALREEILTWFADHPDASPRDILVLCGNWDAYAPLIPLVFNAARLAPAPDAAPNAPERLLPVRIAGSRTRELPPVFTDFLTLLDFAAGRLPADQAFALLSSEAVGPRFGFRPEQLGTLRELLREANIRWGADEAHVERTLRESGVRDDDRDFVRPEGAPPGFTWRRGVDRLLLGQLLGEPDVSATLTSARSPLADAVLGEDIRLYTPPDGSEPYLPIVSFSADAAPLVGGLDLFLRRVLDLRTRLNTPDLPLEALREALLEAVDAFFVRDTAYALQLADLRQAILRLIDRAVFADNLGGPAPAPPLSIVRAALEETLNGIAARASLNIGTDAVVFAPLREGMPYPARLVCLCGLNNGFFPGSDQPPSFDFVMRHPTFLEPSRRDKDALAMLEGICAARQTLVLSCIGRDQKTDAPLPPSPLLSDFVDYVNAHFSRRPAAGSKPDAVAKCLEPVTHHLQAFHPDYFTPEAARAAGYPLSRSQTDWQIARSLLSPREARMPRPRAIPLPDVLTADALVQMLRDPLRALKTRNLAFSDYEPRPIEPEDAVQTVYHNKAALLEGPEKEKLLLWYARLLSERGRSFSSDAALSDLKIADADNDKWERLRRRKLTFNQTDMHRDPVLRKLSFPDRNVSALIAELPPPGQPFTASVTCTSLQPLYVTETPDGCVGERRGTPRVRNRTIELRLENRLLMLENEMGETVPVQLALDWSSDESALFLSGWIRHLIATVAGHTGPTVLAQVERNDDGRMYLLTPMDPEEAYMRLADILSLLASEWLPYFPPQKEVKPKDITLAQSESGELEVPEEMVAFEPDLLMNETFLREQRMEAICGVWTDFDPLNCKLEPSRAPRRTRK